MSAWKTGVAATMLLLASFITQASPVDHPPKNPGPREDRAEITVSATEAKYGTPSDPTEWIRRAQQAASTMTEKVADERAIVLSLASRALVRSGEPEEATALAMNLEPLSRVNALLSIFSIQADSEDSQDMQKTLALIRRELRAMQRKSPKLYQAEAAALLRTLVGIQCNSGEIPEAIKTVAMITPDLDKGSLHFTDNGSVETPAGSYRAIGVFEVAVNQARLGDATGARKTARAIELKGLRDAAHWAIANVLAEEGHLEAAQDLVAELRTAGPPVGEAIVLSDGQPLPLPVSFFASNAFAGIAEACAKSNDFRAAEAAIKSIPTEKSRQQALRKVAEAKIEAGRFSEVKKSLKTITSPEAKEQILWMIGMEQSRRGEIEAAKKTADELSEGAPKASIYCQIGEELFKRGNDRKATEALTKAEELVAQHAPNRRVPILWMIAGTYCNADRREAGRKVFERATRLVADTKEEGFQRQAYALIAEQQIECGELAGARQTLARIDDASSKASLITLLATHQHHAGQKEAARQSFREAFQAALSIDLTLWIENPRSKAASLRSIGNTLADLGELDLVSQFAAGAKNAHSRAPAYLFLGAAEGLMEAGD